MDHIRIVPILGIFAGLFRYALFSIYDSDFYGENSGKSYIITLINALLYNSIMSGYSLLPWFIIVSEMCLKYKCMKYNNYLLICYM